MTTELENDGRSTLAHFGKGTLGIDTHTHTLTHAHTLQHMSGVM